MKELNGNSKVRLLVYLQLSLYNEEWITEFLSVDQAAAYLRQRYTLGVPELNNSSTLQDKIDGLMLLLYFVKRQ